jgi:6-phosphogluconolactonase
MPVETLVRPASTIAADLAARVDACAREAVAARGRFAIALTGGSVATTFFPTLARLPLDWSATDFFWGDERAVPPDDPESNYDAANRLWLTPARVPHGRVHRLPADTPNLTAAARQAERDLVATLGTPPALDLALLGVGPDGHVCSLFPGHPLLAESTRWVAAVEDSPKPPPRRLTLTLPTLAAARLVVFAVTGASKARVVRETVRDERSELPVALLARRARRALLLVDEDAGALLGE